MNVPRPLLVVVIVIIVLGVVACGVGFARGRLENGRPTPDPTTRFEGVSDQTVPRRDVRIVALDGGTCSEAGNPVKVTVANHCRMTIEPRSLRPRKLRLDVAGPPYLVVVTQEIRGSVQSKDKSFTTNDTVEVSVAGTSPVVVDFSCSSCTLTFPG
jgi:hypothetical protein